MRIAFLAAAALLVGCSRGDQPAAAEQSTETQTPAAATLTTYAGEGRNRLCLDERAGRAAFITYGQGDTNCTVQASVQRNGAAATLIPDGDETCRIELATADDTLRLGPASPACAYYCGPNASFANAEFRRTPQPQPVTDLAGDPLC